jgi:hypothetical protein
MSSSALQWADGILALKQDREISWSTVSKIFGLAKRVFSRYVPLPLAVVLPADAATASKYSEILRTTNSTDHDFGKVFDVCQQLACSHVYHKESAAVLVCPLCGSARYKDLRHKRAFRTFTYFSVKEHIKLWLSSARTAEMLKLRPRIRKGVGLDLVLRDWTDGSAFKRFTDDVGDSENNIAIALCADGAQAYRSFWARKHESTPLIAVVFNLPGNIRYSVHGLWMLGVVPGPSAPRLDPFLGNVFHSLSGARCMLMITENTP